MTPYQKILVAVAGVLALTAGTMALAQTANPNLSNPAVFNSDYYSDGVMTSLQNGTPIDTQTTGNQSANTTVSTPEVFDLNGYFNDLTAPFQSADQTNANQSSNPNLNDPNSFDPNHYNNNVTSGYLLDDTPEPHANLSYDKLWLDAYASYIWFKQQFGLDSFNGAGRNGGDIRLIWDPGTNYIDDEWSNYIPTITAYSQSGLTEQDVAHAYATGVLNDNDYAGSPLISQLADWFAYDQTSLFAGDRDITAPGSEPAAHAIYLARAGGSEGGVDVPGGAPMRQIFYEAMYRHYSMDSMDDLRMALRTVAYQAAKGGVPVRGTGVTYHDCGSILNAFAAVGTGDKDTDNDCFPDNGDNCPKLYNPEQKSDDCPDPNQGGTSSYSKGVQQADGTWKSSSGSVDDPEKLMEILEYVAAAVECYAIPSHLSGHATYFYGDYPSWTCTWWENDSIPAPGP